ncbi:Alpha/Beta hydrolase protein [Mycena haematopus]|nr:Alpha/Beta hydrolase protein [Mycena haematopus]
MLPTALLLCLCVSVTHAIIQSPATVGSDLWVLFQNDLDWHTTAEHQSSILLSARTHADAFVACAKLNEDLAPTNSTFFHPDMENTLAYVALTNGASPTQKYWIGGSTSAHGQLCPAVSKSGLSSTACTEKLPVFCANSAPNRFSNQTDLSPKWQIQITSGEVSVTGTRDHLSFRFLGIPYANEPARWTYSSVYTGPPAISALTFGSPCAQGSLTGMENCLFLNIFTPFLPEKSTSSSELKPVMFWIHGGAFTSGESSDPNFDGGNLASRGDVVVVTINYRLGALGFLALDDGRTNGNFGIADQITALKWVQAHIASFGGDPSRITIFGQSAGAGSVRALLGSPPAFGLFAGAIAQSNLGGLAYATTYSEYMTIEQEVDLAARAFVGEVGCGNENGTSTEVLACLRDVPWQTLQTAADAPRYVVVDGTFITRDRLSVDGKGPIASNVHVIFGWMAGDGAYFAGSYPKSTTTQAVSIEGIPVAANVTTAILESGLFPRPSTGNETLDTFNVTARVATDGEFRCVDQATAHSASLHSTFASMGLRPTTDIDPSFRRSVPPVFVMPFRHLGELYFVFGTLGQLSLPFRDGLDLPFEQLTVDAWSAFARTYNPNPSRAFLEARGYAGTAAALQKWGPWEDVKSLVPCEVVGFPLQFYED